MIELSRLYSVITEIIAAHVNERDRKALKNSIPEKRFVFTLVLFSSDRKWLIDLRVNIVSKQPNKVTELLVHFRTVTDKGFRCKCFAVFSTLIFKFLSLQD